MKRIVVVAIAAMIACVSAQTVNATTVSQPEDQSVTFHKKTQDLKTVVFNCPAVHCSSCAKKISENIAFEKGVKGLEVGLANKTVKITYDAKKTNVEKLKEALRKLGFPGEVVE